jgi:hypothetical protein
MSGLNGHIGLLLAGGGGGGASPGAHRYWRCYVTAVGNMSQRILALGWCGWFQNAGDADSAAISNSKTAASSAALQALTSLYNPSKPGVATNASCFNDNGLSSTGPWWFSVDFATALEPKQIGFYPQPNSPENVNRPPKDFQIQWSDDNSTWTTAYTATGFTAAWTIGTEYRYTF